MGLQQWGVTVLRARASAELGCRAQSSRASRALCWAGCNVTPPCLGSSALTSESRGARSAGMQQQGCRAAPGIRHFALLTRYTYCSFFTFLLLLQLILNCSSAVITCCAPAHLHPLPSLAVTSNQHRINCRFAGRKVSLIKRVSKGIIVFMLLSANVSCGDQDRGKGTGRCDGNARRQGTGSRGTRRTHRASTQVRQARHHLGGLTPPRGKRWSCSGWKQHSRGRRGVQW